MELDDLHPRITGLETEYGCLVDAELDSSKVTARIRDWVFENNRFGLIDRHHRDWDEPPGNGGFLYNGGRLYIDMGHLEYCTPECSTVKQVVAYDRAGDLLLNEALDALGLHESVSFIRNNVDHYTGATFGCHENYLLSREAPLTEENVFSLLGFLTLRSVYTGAGRVGGVQAYRMRGLPVEPAHTDKFQVTQRADYIQNDFFEWVQGNRAIINTRDEPLADPYRYRRLHLLHGDTNVLPSALFLKVGTTRLVFDLLERDLLPDVRLSDAVVALQAISNRTEPPWEVELEGRRKVDVVDLLVQYYQAAEDAFGDRDDETKAVLRVWKQVLEAFEANRLDDLVGILDWVTKKTILETFCEAEEISMGHPWIASQDLEYHNVHPERSLGLAMAVRDSAWEIDGLLSKALDEAPGTTRAHLRQVLMRQLGDEPKGYQVDWDSVLSDEGEQFMLNDPFQTQLLV